MTLFDTENAKALSFTVGMSRNLAYIMLYGYLL